jgi:hypothetical protein
VRECQSWPAGSKGEKQLPDQEQEHEQERKLIRAGSRPFLALALDHALALALEYALALPRFLRIEFLMTQPRRVQKPFDRLLEACYVCRVNRKLNLLLSSALLLSRAAVGF